MGYVEGVVAAVPAANKDLYMKHAREMVPLFKEYGAARVVQAWGDDVPDGKVTDFKGAVKAKDDEVVVLSWLEYPSKAIRDGANQKMQNDQRMKEIGQNLPFDGKRLIFGGFDSIVDEAGSGNAGYIDGYVVPVPHGKMDAYLQMALEVAHVFKDYGASRIVEAKGDDVPDGEVTDFKRAVKAKDDENVIFSFIEWPDKATRDEGWKKMMDDPRMQPDVDTMPFDGQRMFWGGFTPLLDE